MQSSMHYCIQNSTELASYCLPALLLQVLKLLLLVDRNKRKRSVSLALAIYHCSLHCLVSVLRQRPEESLVSTILAAAVRSAPPTRLQWSPTQGCKKVPSHRLMTSESAGMWGKLAKYSLSGWLQSFPMDIGCLED